MTHRGKLVIVKTFLVALIVALSAPSSTAQMPPIEPGVSLELAKWRAAHYSDVRYKLNLTLEKMSPVLKGTMEIRVKVSKPSASAGGQSAAPPATRWGASVPSDIPIILDWRKIKGKEEFSKITSISMNGRALVSPDEKVTKSKEDKELLEKFGGLEAAYESNEHLVFRYGKPGENVIKLDFTSPILTSGSAITRYVDKEDGSEYIYSLFVPSDASTAFPVFDQPDLKAYFDLEVDVPKDWNVISNGVKMFSGAKTIGYSAHDTYQRPPVPANLYRHTFTNANKPISTYVFAFAAGPFAQFSETASEAAKLELVKQGRTFVVDGEKVANETFLRDQLADIYVRNSQAEKFKPHAAEVFRLNREAIKYFEEYFDYKFPFPKYDLVLIPEFPFGGMEHAGATFLKESSIIFPQEPTKNDHISRALLIFQKASHHWFGDTGCRSSDKVFPH